MNLDWAHPAGAGEPDSDGPSECGCATPKKLGNRWQKPRPRTPVDRESKPAEVRMSSPSADHHHRGRHLGHISICNGPLGLRTNPRLHHELDGASHQLQDAEDGARKTNLPASIVGIGAERSKLNACPFELHGSLSRIEEAEYRRELERFCRAGGPLISGRALAG